MELNRKSNEHSFSKNTVVSNNFLRYSILVVIILVGEFLFAQTSPPLNMPMDRFRAAVVKKDITPRDAQMLLGYDARKSTGVHDPIFHRIVALDDGTTQFFLVSSDICEISPTLYDSVAAKLYSHYKINPVNFWWTVTHTHSAPEVGSPGLDAVFLGERYQHAIDSNYTALVVQKLFEGILEARKKLAPASLGVGWGFSQANINRRAIDIDGKASLGLNPDGTVDRRIGLLRIDKEDGKPLALIANYPIHGTVLGEQNLQISGDAPGIVSEYVEQQIGSPVLFINGAAGDLAPIYSVYPNPEEGHLGQFRVLLGNKILEANKKIVSTTEEVKLNSGELIVETPRKAGLGWSSDLNKYTSTKKGINMVRLPIRFLKINEDVAIWSAPIELFCEVANEIRKRSPFPYTFYFGYSNGWLGYLPTESAWEHGGYETMVSPYTPTAAKDLTESVTSYLQGEMKSTSPDRAKKRSRN
jgi:neutral/alkaline ceramidase-like enzyme